MKNIQTELSPPGELINVNGRKVHIQRDGNKSPIVVFEAGLWDVSLRYAKIQPEISKITRTISYDRAGMGYSEISSNPQRTSSAMASELFELLDTLNVHEPLILVGSSAGGIYIRELAYQHPELVAGMVFVDSSHENQTNRAQEELEFLKQESDSDSTVEFFKKLSKMTNEEIWDKVQPLLKGVHPDTHKYYKDQARPEQFENFVELDSFFEEDTSQGNDALRVLGDIPLIVLSATERSNPNRTDDQNKLVEEFWSRLQNELTNLSTNSRQIKAESRHDIDNEKPEVVIEAIAEMVKQVRSKL